MGFLIGVEVVIVVFFGLNVGSVLLYMMGVGLGLVVGFGLLLMREVDCEGYDVIFFF